MPCHIRLSAVTGEGLVQSLFKTVAGNKGGAGGKVEQTNGWCMTLRDQQIAQAQGAESTRTKAGGVRPALRLGGMVLGMLLLGGCSIFGGGDDKTAPLEAAEEVYQIGVNAYLWRATLDTIRFMPLLKADQNGGVVLSDWQVNPNNPEERTKAEIYIIGRKLSADSLKVKIHRQQKRGEDWIEVGPRPGAEFQLANAILMQARLLRRNNAPLTN